MPVIVSISAKFSSFIKRGKKTLRSLGERSSLIASHTSFTSSFAINHPSGELRKSGIELSMWDEADLGLRVRNLSREILPVSRIRFGDSYAPSLWRTIPPEVFHAW
jgi:hypothetical protein